MYYLYPVCHSIQIISLTYHSYVLNVLPYGPMLCFPLGIAGIILCMHPVNERRRYIVTSSLIDWSHKQNNPWYGKGGCFLCARDMEAIIDFTKFIVANTDFKII